MKDVVISLGSNAGVDRLRLIQMGISRLSSVINHVVVSSIYETAALGGGEAYLNAVMKGKCEYEADELTGLFKKIEIECGRNEECRRKGVVPLDLDIVIYDNHIVREKDYRCEFFRIGYNEIQ